ncbi:MAG TPA: hypothetical protein VMF35_11155 [Acidimicrobiales bacterium]|nr:hypothetical protein [Acidimicrobiales bacterium]
MQHHDRTCEAIAWTTQAVGLCGKARAAMSEVEICGVPKLSAPEVVPT